jgi:DnaJ-class molecular chaperone
MSHWRVAPSPGESRRFRLPENIMTSQKGPNIKKKQKCKNCEGKGLLKKGDKVVKCQRCGGTGLR